MEDLKELIASVVAYLAKREREEASEYDNYVYAPIRVPIPVEDRVSASDDSVTWRMY